METTTLTETLRKDVNTSFPLFYSTDIERYLASSFLSLVFVVGGGLNVLILMAGCFAAASLKPYHYLVMNLSISDLVFVLTQIPLEWFCILYGSWPFDVVWCTVFLVIRTLLYDVTFFTHAMIAVNRLVGCVLSFSEKAAVFTSARGTIVSIICIWVFCVTLLVPPIAVKYVTVTFNNVIGITDVSYDNGLRALYFWLYLSVIGAWVPLLIIMINYTFICIFIKRSGQSFNSPTLDRNFVKVTKYLFTISVVFLALWLPATIQTIVEMMLGANILAFRITYYTLHCRVLVNPLVYGIKIKEFRQGMIAVFSKRRMMDHDGKAASLRRAKCIGTKDQNPKMAAESTKSTSNPKSRTDGSDSGFSGTSSNTDITTHM